MSFNRFLQPKILSLALLATAVNAADHVAPLSGENAPLLAPNIEPAAPVNLNHLEETFDGYDLELARVIVGANPLVSFFTGLLVMGVILGSSFVLHNTDREKHYFWLPATHIASLVFFLSSIPLTFIWPRCCGSNKPRIRASKKQQLLVMSIAVVLYGCTLFCLWHSVIVQQTANNYNLLVIIFSFVPLFHFGFTCTSRDLCSASGRSLTLYWVVSLPFAVFWPFERGDLLSGALCLILVAASITVGIESYMGFWLDFASDWKLVLICFGFCIPCAGWIVALRRALLISGFRWTLLAHNLFGLIACLTLSLTLHPPALWQKFFQMIFEWGLIWPLLSTIAVLFTYHWGCLANCYFSDSITFASLFWIGFVLGSGKMYGQIRYGVYEWPPEFISGLVLLSIAAILAQIRVWTTSKRVPLKYIAVFPPPEESNVNPAASQAYV